MDALSDAGAGAALPFERRLLVAMHIDIAGYSKLIAGDDVGTLARMAAVRTGVVEPEARRNHGRIVQVVGDSMMIVFESIDRAVESALQIQASVPAVDKQPAAGEEFRFRIGVNIGDVIADDTGLHGEGINVAARLQQACPVGGVCVSRSVYDHLQAGLRRRFRRLGALNLKNIAQPVEAFVAEPERAGSLTATLAGPAEPVAEAWVTTYLRSNDFLAAGDERRLPALLERSTEAVWFIGTTFYITIGQYRALVLRKLAQGLPIHFLILRPDGAAMSTMAQLLGVTAEELRLDCLSGIRVLQRTLADAERQGQGHLLRVRLLDQPFQTRLYVFDPDSAEGATFFVPQFGGTNSQTVPGFLVQHRQSAWLASYFASILVAWNSAQAVSLNDWEPARSAAEPG